MNRKKEKKYIKFNNWVHIILLALSQRMDKSYREFYDITDVCTEILNLLGLSKAPYFTTLQKAAKRLRINLLEKIISGFLLFTMTVNVRNGIDATGFQATRASAHYTTVLKENKKSRRKIKKYIKLTTYVDLDKQIIVSQKIRRSPAHDNRDFKPVVLKGKRILSKAKKKIR